MSYVIAAYGVTLVTLVWYGVRLERQRRRLRERDESQRPAQRG